MKILFSIFLVFMSYGCCMAQLWELNLRAFGNGSVDTSPSDSAGFYRDGTVVTLTATASKGWNFLNWTGDKTGQNLQIVVLMNANKTVNANFVMGSLLFVQTEANQVRRLTAQVAQVFEQFEKIRTEGETIEIGGQALTVPFQNLTPGQINAIKTKLIAQLDLVSIKIDTMRAVLQK